jgi:hypothetical protein
MKPPTKSDVANKLMLLVRGEISRDDAAHWAQQWVIEDTPEEMPNEIWEALQFLCAADMISLDRPYLYEREDFEHELAKLT